MSVQVPKGYKLTEVGVIPEEWELLKIGDVCEIKGRIGFRGYTVNDIVEKGYGAISISPSNINNGKINFERSTYISFDKYEESPEIKIFNGDIVLVKTGSTFGKVALVDGLFEKATLNPQVVVVKKIKINNLYLSFLMGFETFQSQISSSVVGGALPTLSQKLVEKFKIPCPPTFVEQMAVGKALSDADALIESLEQLIAKKRQIKQGAMQELLTGQRRLPGFGGEWKVKSLEAIADIDPEQLSSKTLPDYEFKYISLEDVDFGSLVSHSQQIFSLAPSRARRKLRKNDILVSTVRPNLKSHLWFQHDGVDWICSTGFSVIRCHEGIANPSYVFSHLFAENINKQIDALLTGSNYPAINSRDVRQLGIPLPEFDEQVAISQILNDLDMEVVALQSRLDKARQIKQAMMQELLTGRIRLI